VAATGRLTAAAAGLITSAATSGRELMITCEPVTSVMVAPARSAIDRTTSVPAALSGDASTVQDGSDFQAGGPDGSRLRDQAGAQIGEVRQDDRVAVAVGHEGGHADSAEPLQLAVIRDAPVTYGVVLSLSGLPGRQLVPLVAPCAQPP
jgi:hypothetical protein